jgi:hypothetical protein
MGDQLIENPSAAFKYASSGDTITTPPGVPGQTYKVMYNSGAVAIKSGGWVALDVAGTAGHISGCKAGVHGGTLREVVGIALDAIPVGGYGRVCTEGPCLALGSTAGITAGDQITGGTASTDDQCVMTASTPTVGQVIGTALQTSAAVVATPLAVWVRPS